MPNDPLDFDQLPRARDIGDWEDANLFSRLGYRALRRYDASGGTPLNEAELTLAAITSLVNEINNGGFGQWLYQVPTELIRETERSLRQIDASSMADLVAEVLREISFNDATKSDSELRERLDSVPEEMHLTIEGRMRDYLRIEDAFLDKVYSFVREHWRELIDSSEP